MLAQQTKIRTYHRPRASVVMVIRRTFVRLLQIQVWDIAGTMTFYALLSVLPALVSFVSLISLIGFADETVDVAANLIHELLPAIDPSLASATILALANTSGGMLGLVLGLVGSMFSASNAMAAFHRAMHRIYDTSEGRIIFRFRARVYVETLLLMFAVVALLLLIILGGDFSRRLGEMLGLTAAAVNGWNVLKWPVILVVLIIIVSLMYYSGPNVKLPRFRIMTTGGAFTVLVLFSSLLALGWMIEYVGLFNAILNTLNGTIAIIVLVWIGFIVVVCGATWDAELLRARQLAAGLPAWDELQLRPQHTGVLEYMARDAARTRRFGQLIVKSVHDDEPVTTERNAQLVEEGSWFAIKAGKHRVTTGQPFSSTPIANTEETATIPAQQIGSDQ